MRKGQRLTGRETTEERQSGHKLQVEGEYSLCYPALNTAAHVAAANDQLEVLRMLAENNFNFRAGEDLKNNEGTACFTQVTKG